MSQPFHRPTGIVMLNLGGPASLGEVEPFLRRLFSDREILPLPFQSRLGPFIAHMRAPKVRAHYEMIGGGSPLLAWMNRQGQGLTARLDALLPDAAPFRFYPAFRYAPPFTDDALRQMRADGVERAVAFTQYPQYSCATTGSSLNELRRALSRVGLERAFQWSLIDRWPVHPGFVAALAASIREGLEAFPASERGEAVLLFSAHSLPLSVVNRGDPYPQEIGATVQAVMARLNFSHAYLLAYQSAAGPVPWLGPDSGRVLRLLGKQGRRSVLLVPVAFTSDHIETLHEIDIEFRATAEAAGIRRFHRAPALNDDPLFLDALADIVRRHLESGELCSAQYRLRCPGCQNDDCRRIPLFAEENM